MRKSVVICVTQFLGGVLKYFELNWPGQIIFYKSPNQSLY